MKLLIAVFLSLPTLGFGKICQQLHETKPTLSDSMRLIQRELNEADLILNEAKSSKILDGAADHLLVVEMITKEVIAGARDQYAPKKLQTIEPEKRDSMLNGYEKMWKGFLVLIQQYRSEIAHQASLPVEQRDLKKASDISLTIREFANHAHYRF